VKANQRLMLDLGAFALITLQTNPAFSGLPIHQVTGLLLVVPLAIHVILNWSWAMTAIDRFLGKVRPSMRYNLIVDMGLFLSMMTVGISGLLIMPGLAGLARIPVSPIWHSVHLAASNLTIAFFAAHFALHGRWMLNVVRRFFDRATGTPRGASVRPGTATSSTAAATRAAAR
jgi:hypothetical protein